MHLPGLGGVKQEEAELTSLCAPLQDLEEPGEEERKMGAGGGGSI